MITLIDLRERLKHQFLDPFELALPQYAQDEAILSALERINSFLQEQSAIEGLEGCLESSLPEGHLPALLTGAAANCLNYLLRQQLGSYSNTAVEPEYSQEWATHLNRQFDAELDRLRLLKLQSAPQAPYSAWPWIESSVWQA